MTEEQKTEAQAAEDAEDVELADGSEDAVSAAEDAAGDGVAVVEEEVVEEEDVEPLTLDRLKKDVSRFKAAWWKPLQIAGLTYANRVRRALDASLAEIEGDDEKPRKRP